MLVTPDLWGGHGEYTCNTPTTATFRVEVQNWGLERVGDNVVVGFYKGDPDAGGVRMGEALTTRTLEPRGDSEVVEFEADLSGVVTDWYAVLDDPADSDEGSVAECREGNNKVLIWRPDCSTAF